MRVLHFHIIIFLATIEFFVPQASFGQNEVTTFELVPDQLIERYFSHYELVKNLDLENSSSQDSLEILTKNNDLTEQISTILFGPNFSGPSRSQLLKVYSASLNTIANYKHIHPEATFQLFDRLQQTWYLKYGFYHLKPWVKEGETIGLASGVLSGLFTLSAIRRLKPSKLKTAFQMSAHFFPALGIMTGKEIAKKRHRSTVFEHAPTPPSQFFSLNHSIHPVYDEHSQKSDENLALALSWATSAGTLTLSQKVAAYLSKGRWALKGTKWTLLGFASSAILSTLIDEHVFHLIQRIRINELHQNYYHSIAKLQSIRQAKTNDDRFERFLLTKDLVRSTYDLFFFQIHPFQKAIKENEEKKLAASERFVEETKGVNPKSGEYQKLKEDFERKINILSVELSKNLLTLLKKNQYQWDRPILRSKIRWLLINGRTDEIYQYDPKVVELAAKWIEEAENKEIQDFQDYFQSQQKKDFQARSEVLLKKSHSRPYLNDPTETIFDVISLIETFNEPLLKNDLIDLTILANAFEADLETHLLKAAKPIPLASEFSFTQTQKNFERYVERYIEFNSIVKNPQTPNEVKRHYAQMIKTDAIAFTRILSHFDAIELNQFYLNFLSKKFVASEDYWAPIHELTSALKENDTFTKKLNKQLEYTVQDPLYQYAEKVVCAWIVFSFVKGAGKGLGLWKGVDQLAKKLGRLPHAGTQSIASISRNYNRLFKMIHQKTPTRLGKWTVNSLNPVIANLSVAIPTGSTWLWVEQSLHTQIIDPSALIQAWHLSALTGIYENQWQMLKYLEAIDPKDLKENPSEVQKTLQDAKAELEAGFSKAVILERLNPSVRGFFEISLVPLRTQILFQITRWKLNLERNKQKRDSLEESKQNPKETVPKKKIK